MRLAKIFIAIIAPDDRLPSSATLEGRDEAKRVEGGKNANDTNCLLTSIIQRLQTLCHIDFLHFPQRFMGKVGPKGKRVGQTEPCAINLASLVKLQFLSFRNLKKE